MGIKLTKEDIKNRTFCIMVLHTSVLDRIIALKLIG